MRPSLKSFTCCLYFFATKWSGSAKPVNGIFSFFQYCLNATGMLGPTAMISTPRLVNFSYSSRKRANCARQYGHIKPRRNTSTTGFPRKSDKRTFLASTSCNSKSGANSPGAMTLLILDQFFCLCPNLIEHLCSQSACRCVLLTGMIGAE